MKILYIDCGMGAAGDMLMGALVSLLPSETEQKEFIEKLNQAGIPDVTVYLENDVKCGITGKHVKVLVHGHEEESLDRHEHGHEEESRDWHEHEHSHETDKHNCEGHGHSHGYGHDHGHDHSQGHHQHASMTDIEHMISRLSVSNTVKLDVRAIYRMIAEAESKVHGKEVSEVHFHEVGMADALCDITGCAMLLEKLQPDKIVVSPVNVGFGKVRCAHGILPVPAPAAAYLLQGVPCYAGRIEGELCTPTGAAILKYYADRFAEMPPMVMNIVGYGTGQKDFAAANVVRAVLGETGSSDEEVIELVCNLDDMTAEEIGYAEELLLEQGALEVYTTAVGMKKSRPGILLSVMCKEESRDRMIRLIFQHTSTIGLREKRCGRVILKREEYTFHSSIGDIRMKESSGYGVVKRKPEYEDLKRIAEKNGMSIGEVKLIIEKEQ